MGRTAVKNAAQILKENQVKQDNLEREQRAQEHNMLIHDHAVNEIHWYL